MKRESERLTLGRVSLSALFIGLFCNKPFSIGLLS